jgi:hypothetical protein
MPCDEASTRLQLIAEGKRLEQENSHLRAASHPFGPIAERLWLRLKTERRTGVPECRAAQRSPSLRNGSERPAAYASEAASGFEA